jgi:transcription elongation factor GreA
MEAKIRQIKHTLENSEVRAADNSGKVAIGTIVTVIDDDGDEMDYFIAAAENKVAGMILASPTSPVGSALLGALPCDQVSYQAPGGTFTMTVEAIGLYEG